MPTPTKPHPTKEARSPFYIFEQFPEFRVGLFAKAQRCSSDKACAAHLGFKKVAKLNQVHGNVIHVVETPLSPPPDGDGMITSISGLALSVRFADCQNFVVYAPRRSLSRTEPRDSGQAPCGVLGVLHVGWRGLAKGAITAFYEKLREEFRIQPSVTFVGAGPSLCKHCATFTNPYEELPEHLHPFVDGRNVDLIAAAEAECDALGIPKNHRERHPACTMCDPRWHSYRRDQDPEARNYLAAGIASLPSRRPSRTA